MIVTLHPNGVPVQVKLTPAPDGDRWVAEDVIKCGPDMWQFTAPGELSAPFTADALTELIQAQYMRVQARKKRFPK
jgi:hypothetical protein